MMITKVDMSDNLKTICMTLRGRKKSSILRVQYIILLVLNNQCKETILFLRSLFVNAPRQTEQIAFESEKNNYFSNIGDLKFLPNIT